MKFRSSSLYFVQISIIEAQKVLQSFFMLVITGISADLLHAHYLFSLH